MSCSAWRSGVALTLLLEASFGVAVRAEPNALPGAPVCTEDFGSVSSKVHANSLLQKGTVGLGKTVVEESIEDSPVMTREANSLLQKESATHEAPGKPDELPSNCMLCCDDDDGSEGEKQVSALMAVDSCCGATWYQADSTTRKYEMVGNMTLCSPQPMRKSQCVLAVCPEPDQAAVIATKGKMIDSYEKGLMLLETNTTESGVLLTIFVFTMVWGAKGGIKCAGMELRNKGCSKMINMMHTVVSTGQLPPAEKRPLYQWPDIDELFGESAMCYYRRLNKPYACVVGPKMDDGTYEITWDDGDRTDTRKRRDEITLNR